MVRIKTVPKRKGQWSDSMVVYRRANRKEKKDARKDYFSVKDLGLPATGKGPSNTHSWTASTPIDSRVLYSLDVTALNQGDGENLRSRRLAEVLGIKLRFDMMSLLGTADMTYYGVNIAVISPRGKMQTPIVFNLDFFRFLFGSADTRDRGFTTAMTFGEMHKTPINTDKWTVLHHERFYLDPWKAGVNQFHKSFEKYIPINRLLTFNNDSNTDCNDPIYVVYWYDTMTAVSGTPSLVGGVHMDYYITTYFRDKAD